MKITFTKLPTNHFVSTTKNSIKFVVNLIPLRIRVRSRNTQNPTLQALWDRESQTFAGSKRGYRDSARLLDESCADKKWMAKSEKNCSIRTALPFPSDQPTEVAWWWCTTSARYDAAPLFQEWLSFNIIHIQIHHKKMASQTMTIAEQTAATWAEGLLELTQDRPTDDSDDRRLPKIMEILAS